MPPPAREAAESRDGQEPAPDQQHEGARRAGRRAIVSIRDTGIGVPAGELSHIFDRFHRATNARAKTKRAAGLGLALVRTMLLARGCRIWIESVEGEGATVYFTLPLPARRR